MLVGTVCKMDRSPICIPKIPKIVDCPKIKRNIVFVGKYVTCIYIHDIYMY